MLALDPLLGRDDSIAPPIRLFRTTENRPRGAGYIIQRQQCCALLLGTDDLARSWTVIGHQ
jgi:hypothetical protein